MSSSVIVELVYVANLQNSTKFKQSTSDFATTEAYSPAIETTLPRMTSTSIAERRMAVSRSKNVPWFQPKIGSSLTPAGRQLLETYSGVDPSDIENHLHKIVGTPTSSKYLLIVVRIID